MAEPNTPNADASKPRDAMIDRDTLEWVIEKLIAIDADAREAGQRAGRAADAAFHVRASLRRYLR